MDLEKVVNTHWVVNLENGEKCAIKNVEEDV